jgi:hypothetical protein
MSSVRLQRLAVLQWVGLLAGALTWTAAHLAGIGIDQAECNAGSANWSISHDTWQAALSGISLALVLAAEACAILAFLGTRGAEFGSGPPEEGWVGERKPTRIHFFSTAAIAANAIFLMIIVLDGTANLVDVACRQG